MRPLERSIRTVRADRYALVGLVGLLAALAVPLPSLVAPAATTHGASGVHPFVAAASGLSWTNLPLASSLAPPLRSGAALAYDPLDGYVVLFGGTNRHVGALADTWKFADGSWTNLTTSLAVAPSPRSGASLAYDAADGYLLLFGGIGPGGALADTWTFAHGAWSPLAISGAVPPARSFAQMTAGPGATPLVLFGGISTTGVVLADTWTFAHGGWAQPDSTASVGPSARAGGGFAYDAVDGYALLFGGTSALGTYPNDTWAYTSQGWVDLSIGLLAAPTGRGNTTLTYDPGREQVLLFGGWSGASLGDTWAFAHGSWTSLTTTLTTSPGARYGAASTYDANDGYLLLFGGVLGSAKYETWVLLSPLAASIGLGATYVAPAAPTTFTAQATGGVAPFNDSWQFGDGSAAVVGTTVTHTFAASGTYNVSVTVVDAVGEVITAFAPVAVRTAPALNVTVAASIPHPGIGQAVTFTAAPSGGAAPYAFAWSAPAGFCPSSAGPTLTCSSPSVGSIGVSVTVSDASGQRATAGLSVPVGTPTVASGATPAVASPLAQKAFLVPIAALIAGAVVIALLMYVAGRRRAKRLLATRPLCYAVPAWSETPPEYPGDDRSAPRDRL